MRFQSGTRPRRRTAGGFSLLEAVVSLVLIAGFGAALFGWISGNLDALARIRAENARTELSANVLEAMRTVNPMLTPQGEVAVGEHRLRWESRLETKVVDRSPSIYQIALFRTRASVFDRRGEEVLGMSLTQVGYQQVRSPRVE